MKKVAFILAFVMLFGMLAGCSSGDNSNGSTGGDSSVIKVGITMDLQNLDPWTYNGARLLTLPVVYESLAEYADGRLQPEVAKEWHEIEGTEFPAYEVTIYDNVYDSEGNHLTAADVVWCYGMHEEANVNNFPMFVDHLEYVDEVTFRVYMNTFTVTRFERLMNGMFLCTKAAWEASTDAMVNTPVGTGPYKVTDYQSGTLMVLEKRDDYWKTEDLTPAQTANFDKIEYHIITEASQIAIGLQSGEIDIASPSAELVGRFQEGGSSSEGFAVDSVHAPAPEQFLLNCAPGAVLADNVNLRQAIMHAINPEDILIAVANGYGEVLHDIGSGANIGDYPTELNSMDYFKYDPNLAAQYLADAGYAPGELTLRLMYQTSDSNASIAQVIQNNLGAIGITVELMNYEGALYEQYSRDPSVWDLMIYHIIGSITYGQQWIGVNNGMGFYEDPEFLRLIGDAMNVKTAGTESYMALHNYNEEQAYVRGLITIDTFNVYNTSKISALVYGRDGSFAIGACTPAA